jgi:hypothetical protein
LSFKYSGIDSLTFTSLNQLRSYIEEENVNVTLVPLENFISSNALFTDDEFFGRGKYWVSFNENGYYSFCEKLGIPSAFIKSLQEDNLASKVINDFLSSSGKKEEMKNYSLVINKSNNTVLGLVGKNYLKYSNKEFLDDLSVAFPKLYSQYDFAEGYIINTKLYLRLLSPKLISGYTKGTYYEGNDFSKIGMQLTNSMVGNSSVKVNYYIFRALCSNGLVVKALESETKVMHSGKKESIIKRLNNNITPIFKCMPRIETILKDLVKLEFNPRTLVQLNAQDIVYNIISLNPQEQNRRKNIRKSQDLMEFDCNILSQYPYRYGGSVSKQVFESRYRNNQSMFDFINVLTEYAHSSQISTQEKIRIEEKTGDLVNWLIINKTKIMKLNDDLKCNRYGEQDRQISFI